MKKGLTLVPLSIYLKGGLAKLELGLAKGKTAPDQRRAIQKKRRRETNAGFNEKTPLTLGCLFLYFR